jgi:medium-chain acyl-[acyl-carrier-protein] hydrolase
MAAEISFGPYSYTILGTDADWQDRLQPASLFSFMQEAAYSNAEALQMGASVLDGRGLCWILIHIASRFDEMPRWGETMTITTWHRGVNRLTFYRDYEFLDQQGRCFGHATSEWLVADATTHRPQRPDTVFADIPAQPAGRSVFATPPERPQPLAEAALVEPVLACFADYADIDRNRHVNNTRYIAWCLNTVAASVARAGSPNGGGLPELRVRGIDIHYINEVFFGTKVFSYCQLEQTPGGSCLVEARRAADAAPVFRARVILA